jgi:hypothetical protein
MSKPTDYTLREQAKAVISAVLAGLTALGYALADNTVTGAEIVGIIVAAVATYGTVFGVSNTPARRNQRGETSGLLLLVIVVAAATAIIVHILL